MHPVARWIVGALILAALVGATHAVVALAQTGGAKAKAAAETPEDADEGSGPAKKGPKPKGFFEILFSGGVVGVIIMLALLALSFTAIALIVDNAAFALRKDKLLPPGLADQVRQLTAAGRPLEAERACDARPSFLAAVLRRGLTESEYGWTEVEKALEEGLAEQTAAVFRRVEYLSVIGNLAPMLGLLGTVTGMLMAFQEVALSQGSAGAAELAEGIYQALVTTVVGLIIAIPALGAFAIFRNRVDQLAAEGGAMALAALSPLKKRSITVAAGATQSSSPPASPGGISPPPPPPRR